MQQGQDDILVFVGECEDALHAPADVEDGADEHDPVDANLTLERLALHRHRHVHCHRCRRVGVDVNFGGRTRRRKFSPATTVSVVTRWARKALRLDDAAAAEYVLRLCGTNDQPRPDKHLGELVSLDLFALFRLREGGHAAGVRLWICQTSASSRRTLCPLNSATAW